MCASRGDSTDHIRDKGVSRPSGLLSGWRGPHSQRSFPMLLLAFVLVVARHTTLNHVGPDAVVVPDELVRQSGTRKAGLRLRNDGPLLRPVQGDEQRIAGESNLDLAGALEIQPFVDADIFRQDFGSDL